MSTAFPGKIEAERRIRASGRFNNDCNCLYCLYSVKYTTAGVFRRLRAFAVLEIGDRCWRVCVKMSAFFRSVEVMFRWDCAPTAP